MCFVKRCDTIAASLVGAGPPIIPTIAEDPDDAARELEDAMIGSMPCNTHWYGDQGGGIEPDAAEPC